MAASITQTSLNLNKLSESDMRMEDTPSEITNYAKNCCGKNQDENMKSIMHC